MLLVSLLCELSLIRPQTMDVRERNVNAGTMRQSSIRAFIILDAQVNHGDVFRLWEVKLIV